MRSPGDNLLFTARAHEATDHRHRARREDTMPWRPSRTFYARQITQESPEIQWNPGPPRPAGGMWMFFPSL
jgi:hypothetical protein